MTNDDAVRLDATLNVLADETRRYLLDRLRTGETLSVHGLSADLASDDGAHVTTAAIATERKSIETSLRHVHLPKMADAGVIDWNPETGRIATNGHTQVAFELLAISHQPATCGAHQKVSEQS